MRTDGYRIRMTENKCITKVIVIGWRMNGADIDRATNTEIKQMLR